jgi:hypothetical protein
MLLEARVPTVFPIVPLAKSKYLPCSAPPVMVTYTKSTPSALAYTLNVYVPVANELSV